MDALTSRERGPRSVRTSLASTLLALGAAAGEGRDDGHFRAAQRSLGARLVEQDWAIRKCPVVGRPG